VLSSPSHACNCRRALEPEARVPEALVPAGAAHQHVRRVATPARTTQDLAVSPSVGARGAWHVQTAEHRLKALGCASHCCNSNNVDDDNNNNNNINSSNIRVVLGTILFLSLSWPRLSRSSDLGFLQPVQLNESCLFTCGFCILLRIYKLVWYHHLSQLNSMGVFTLYLLYALHVSAPYRPSSCAYKYIKIKLQFIYCMLCGSTESC
jgi:hypothetical protein